MKLAISKNAGILAAFAVTCTLLVGMVHLFTKDKIAEQSQQHLLNSLFSIIDKDKINNDLYHDCQFISDALLGKGIEQTIYLARNNNQPIAAALTTSALDGYNGRIDLLVALNYDGSISGVRTIHHQETPGLGDKIELRKNNWITSFEGKRVENENDPTWAVKKDGGSFDQFTGATITPRAVVKAVKKASLYFKQHKEALFAKTSSCRGNND